MVTPGLSRVETRRAPTSGSFEARGAVLGLLRELLEIGGVLRLERDLGATVDVLGGGGRAFEHGGATTLARARARSIVRITGGLVMFHLCYLFGLLADGLGR